MNNNDTFDILHSEFNDCPELPDSLSKRNVVVKLKNISQEKNTTISFRKIGTLAAALIVVMVCAIVATPASRDNHEIAQDSMATTSPLTQPAYNNQIIPENETALLRADSREEIVAMFKESYKENSNKYYFLYGLGSDMDDLKDGTVVTSIASDSSGVVNESYNNTTSGSAVDHAETNTQTAGVDEGDIIKTDSRYIYFVGSDGSGNKKLKIIDTLTMTAVYNSYLYDENGDIIWVSDMYLKDDILVAVCAKKAAYNTYASSSVMIDALYSPSASTVIVSYDITDRANPKLIRRETQDGSYRSSRLIGNILYTVSQYYVRAENEETLENVCIPKVSGTEIACDCIYLPENMGDSYICMTALDITDKDGKISAVAVLGETDNFYCSQNTFYIVADNYYNSSEYKTKDANGYTIINAFSLDGLNISYKATGEVKGSTAKSQYSFDEYNNVLRVATTYYNYKTQKNESSVYTLDENLDVIGKLEDIANNELIKSVRYMGEKAYIVTFRNTDPLFAIDLSDPKNPKVLGELKLPGYSAYLHPISENLLLGIGYDGDANNADFNSVKVSLFDISDPVNLKELDNIILNDKNVSTPVNNNPKALIYKADEGIIGFPIETYDYNVSDYVEYGYYLIKVQDNELKTMHKLIHEDSGYIDIYSFRGTYIGDKFFTVSNYIVKKFDFATGKEIAQWSNSEGVNLVPTTSAAENKDIYDLPSPTITATTQASTSRGYFVDEPETTSNSGVTGQTTPPYNPNNPRAVTEMPTEW